MEVFVLGLTSATLVRTADKVPSWSRLPTEQAAQLKAPDETFVWLPCAQLIQVPCVPFTAVLYFPGAQSAHAVAPFELPVLASLPAAQPSQGVEEV